VIVLPGDDRLWEIGPDYRIPLAHAVFLAVALLVLFIWLKLATRTRR
jgi:hypothetical protein